jgi:hypothetical protein
MHRVTSVQELIAQLGGPSAAARIFRTSPQNICNWKNKAQIPAKFHRVHASVLDRESIEAPPTLWGFVEDSA